MSRRGDIRRAHPRGGARGFPGWPTWGPFVTASYLEADANEGLRGSSAGFWVAVLWYQPAAQANTHYIAQCGAPGSRGWHLRAEPTNLRCIFRVANSIDTVVDVTSPNNSVVADAWNVALCVFEGDATQSKIDVNNGGYTTAAHTALSVYTPPSASDRFVGGNRDNGNSPLDVGTLRAVAGSDAGPPAGLEDFLFWTVAAAKGPDWSFFADTGPGGEGAGVMAPELFWMAHDLTDRIGTGEDLHKVETGGAIPDAFEKSSVMAF